MEPSLFAHQEAPVHKCCTPAPCLLRRTCTGNTCQSQLETPVANRLACAQRLRGEPAGILGSESSGKGAASPPRSVLISGEPRPAYPPAPGAISNALRPANNVRCTASRLRRLETSLAPSSL